MTTTPHDDLPHPVPPYAYVRWKENYFFIILDAEREVFGVCHINNEPMFDRSRFALNLSIRGRNRNYAGETRMPEDFAFSRELSDGKLTLQFLDALNSFRLLFKDAGLQMDLIFEKRFPTFDFATCQYAAPDIPSFKELMSYGMNLPFNHHQQAMTVTGTLLADDEGTTESYDIKSYAYRDHSWSMRTDNAVARHVWSGLHFPDRAFGVMTISTLARQNIEAREGYTADSRRGAIALTAVDVRRVGEKDGWPAKLEYQLADVYGQRFSIEADIANRHADVPLFAEAASGRPAYRILETMSPLKLKETGEVGIGIVEVGRHPLAEAE